MTPSPRIETASSPEALASCAAAFIAQRIAQAHGRFALCLSGGSTPRPVYERLGAAEALAPQDWERVHLFWGDERYVPQGHRDSNFRMAQEALLGRLAIPPAQVHPVPTECATPQEAAASYEAALQSFYGADTLDPARPLFDMTLLGLGEDGHIASLFPGTAALGERRAWVTAVLGARPEPRI
ncbi:MAG TPA: 6-phosphogluconolactonase, partial [Methylocella sp.]|nr:6-phosphogluconolactonase [Methylocella sp.]